MRPCLQKEEEEEDDDDDDEEEGEERGERARGDKTGGQRKL